MHQISAENHTKEYGSKEELLILKYNLDGRVHKNTKICVRIKLTPFVGIYLLSTHMNWLLLMQVKESRSILVWSLLL